MPIQSGQSEQPADMVEPGSVLILEADRDGFTQMALDGRHGVLVDEPVAQGGRDAGPSPYELLLMSLGSCTAMTLRLYARRKGWPLERVQVRLTHRKVHAVDCKSCETRKGYIDRIERRVALFGPLDDGQRARLHEIAEMCPVHRTLQSDVLIETMLAVSAE